MCVMSMVHDHFGPLIPDVTPWGTTPPSITPIDLSGLANGIATAQAIAELRQLIADFRAAVEAAAKVDLLTKQPDCVDPEKAKLEERVARLEKALAGLPAY
jgi:hypothetical protein